MLLSCSKGNDFIGLLFSTLFLIPVMSCPVKQNILVLREERLSLVHSPYIFSSPFLFLILSFYVRKFFFKNPESPQISTLFENTYYVFLHISISYCEEEGVNDFLGKHLVLDKHIISYTVISHTKCMR